MVGDDGIGIAILQRSELRGDVPSHQAITLDIKLAHLAIVAHHHRASVIDITKSEVGSIGRSAEHAIHLSLLIEADTGEAIVDYHP